MQDLPAEFYDDVRALARRIDNGRGSIAPTELLHEAWAKLANSDGRYTDPSACYHRAGTRTRAGVETSPPPMSKTQTVARIGHGSG